MDLIRIQPITKIKAIRYYLDNKKNVWFNEIIKIEKKVLKITIQICKWLSPKDCNFT